MAANPIALILPILHLGQVRSSVVTTRRAAALTLMLILLLFACLLDHQGLISSYLESVYCIAGLLAAGNNITTI
jgi:hypothetical protein